MFNSKKFDFALFSEFYPSSKIFPVGPTRVLSRTILTAASCQASQIMVIGTLSDPPRALNSKKFDFALFSEFYPISEILPVGPTRVLFTAILTAASCQAPQMMVIDTLSALRQLQKRNYSTFYGFRPSPEIHIFQNISKTTKNRGIVL